MSLPPLRRAWHAHLLLPLALLALGVLASAKVGWVLNQSVEADAGDAFARNVERIAYEVPRRFQQPIYGLMGARGVYAASRQVGREEFGAYVASRNMPREFPGVRGFGFIQRVQSSELEAFVADERADGAPDFAVRRLEAVPRDDLYVIKYIEPAAANRGAMGLDVGSEPRRREAIEKAIDTASPIMTAPIQLVQADRTTPGSLLYVPVYRNGAALDTPAQRRAALTGVAYAPLVFNELLDGAVAVVGGQVEFVVEDPAVQTGSDSPLFASGAGQATARGQLFATRTIEVPGRRLQLQVYSTPVFDAQYEHATPWLVFAGGVLASALLAALMWQQATGRQRAERLAQGMTAHLDRLALVARRTSNAVVITDAARRIVWVNEGFERITGYSAAEVHGRSPGVLLQTTETDAATVARLRAALDAGITFTGEILNRSRHGRLYWLELEIQPLRDAAGQLTGFMAIESDISERKATMAALDAARAELTRLAMVAQRTSNAVIITDRALRIEWVNDAFTRLYGFDRATAIGRKPGELLGSEATSPQALETLKAAAEAGTGCRVEVVNRTADGRQVWVDTEVQPAVDAEGRVVGFVEIASDITGRRAAEQRMARLMRENEALLSTIRAHAIVSVADARGVILDANDAFCAISGYTREELVGQPHNIVNSGVQPAAFWASMWNTISIGQPWRGQICNRAKDGSLYWVDSIIAPFAGADGRIEKYVSLRTDITASKRATQELARQRQRLASIISGTQAGTWEFDIDHDELVINGAYASMLGYSLEECLGLMGGKFDGLVHPDDLVPVNAKINAHLHGVTREYEADFRMRHKDGHWVWVQSRGMVTERDGAGRPLVLAGIHLDISQRKHDERELARGRQRLANIIEGTNVGTWEWNVETGQTVFNEHWAQIVGYSLAELGPTTIETWSRLTHPDDLSRSAVLLEQHFNGESPTYECEARMRHKDGHWVWVLDRGKLFGRSADGRPRWMAGTHMDITERKHAESALHTMTAELERNAALLHTVIESLPCALSVFDGDLKLIVANREFGRLLELPDPLGQAGLGTFEAIIRHNAARGEYGEGDVEATVAGIVERARGAVVPHQFERVRPNGVTLEVRGGPLPGGGFVTTYTDVTARRTAEGEARRSSELLRGAIDTIDEAFVLFDPDDRLLFCNDKYLQMYDPARSYIRAGEHFEQILRQGVAQGRYAEAEGRVEEWIAERMATHRAGDTALVQRLADGRSLRIVERRMPDGHTVGFRIDITEMMRAAEAAQAASRAKSQFLANMSHEIRTPMNAVLGMLALLRKTALTPRQTDYVVKTEGAARSLLGLLNDILDFSKVEAGKMALDPQPFRADRLLRELSVILSANVGAKPVEVLFDVDPALPPVLLGDAMRLQQVLINLGGNAIKFTARGEVVVSVMVRERRGDEVLVRFAVRDTGIGIAPENQARIFSGFTQAEASTTRRYGGTGLGVAISQRLVGLMGGELRLDSALGAGSCFHFDIALPVAQDGEATPAAAPMHALVVDDNPTAREVLERMGRSLGWTIDVAAGGEEALQRLQARAASGRAYQAVFVDWQMPGLDGWETSRRIRELGLAGAAPVVVMVTAHGREMLAQRSSDEQSLLDGFLVKPVTPAMLRDAVAEARGVALPRPPADAPPPLRRLEGLRLLVVEDNPNNQQVARELLEDEGATVQIAGDGLQGLQAVAAASPPFDVVLMDLQMPVMDGFTATCRIRQDLGLQSLPIVAMTANAMASDREASLAAGMNDHVGKPFDLDHLVRVLRRHAGLPETLEGTADGASPAPPSALPADVAVAAAAARVELEVALARLGGKPEVYRRLLGGFVADLARAPAELAAALAQGDRGAAARLLHTVKGVAATLGAQALAASAAAGEQRLAGPSRSDEADALQACADALAAAVPGLQALQAAMTPAPVETAAGDADPAAAAAALRTLAALLQQSDMAALEVFASLQREHAATLGAPLAALDASISGLDFDAALRQCQQLLDTCTP